MGIFHEICTTFEERRGRGGGGEGGVRISFLGTGSPKFFRRKGFLKIKVYLNKRFLLTKGGTFPRGRHAVQTYSSNRSLKKSFRGNLFDVFSGFYFS